VSKPTKFPENLLSVIAGLVPLNHEEADFVHCVQISKEMEKKIFLPHRWRAVQFGSKLGPSICALCSASRWISLLAAPPNKFWFSHQLIPLTLVPSLHPDNLLATQWRRHYKRPGTMDPENPVEIPELAEFVASYLKRNDLASCLQVSKKWRDLFLPHRWQTIAVGPKNHHQFDLRSTIVFRYRHLIRELSLLGGTSGLDFLNQSNQSNQNEPSLENTNRKIVLGLSEMFPVLVNLDLTCVKMTTATWRAISAHTHIRILKLTHLEVDAVDAPGFWETCREMEALQMTNVTIDGGSIPKGVSFDRLRNLVMLKIAKLDEADQLDLVLRSPKLESLQWSIDTFRSVGKRTLLSNSFQDNHWPHLNKLHIYGDLQDTDVASILRGVGNSLGRFADLKLSRCLLQTQVSKALDLHFSALVKVDLAESHSESCTTLDILCCCSRLEILRGGKISTNGLAERGPWVCQQLRELSTRIWVREHEKHLQPLIFERLSTLTRLERFSMWTPVWNDSHDGVLEFRLECGLGQLESLQQLASIHFALYSMNGSHYPQLGMDEVAWMASNWKKLKKIKGRFNKDPRLDSDLRNAIELYGISTAW